MIARVALALFAASTIGCRITATSRFYTLTSVAAPAAASSEISIAVGSVSVPGAVDRSEMVMDAGANEVRVDEFHRWAAPLQDNLARVVAQNLAKLLGTPRVVLSSAAASAEPEYRVDIEVLAFESSLGRFTALDAVWTVRRGSDGPSQSGRTTVRENVSAPTYEAIASAHSRAVARMSRDIAGAVQAMAAARPRSDAHHISPTVDVDNGVTRIRSSAEHTR